MISSLRSNPNERDVVVLGGTVAIALGVMYWMLRAGFDNPTAPVINSVGLSLFLLVFPLGVRGVSARMRSEISDAWFLSHAFLWLCGMLVVALLGYVVPMIGLNPFIAILSIGVIGFGVVLIRWIGGKGPIRSSGYLMSAAAFAVWSGGVVWGRIYKNPLFVESLVADGTAHHDTLHLAALANMLRTYHAASIGIDGLTYEPYHWGSPWLFAQWANLVGIDVLRFYQLTFPVIGIPFFFGGVALFAITLRNRTSIDREPWRAGWKFWALLSVIAIGFLPIGGLDAMGVWTSNLLISESYTMAVPAALLMAAATFSFAQNLNRDGVDLAKAQLRKSDLLFLLVLVPIGIGTLGYLKISLMVLALAAAIFLLLRLSLWRRPPYLISAVLSAGIFVFVYPRVSLPAHREGFVPFDFLSSFVPLQWWPFYLFIHLMWTWIYVGVRLRAEHILTLGDLVAAIKDKRIVDVELVVGIALLGIIPGLIIHIDGGSAFYFSDVQRWLAAGLLLAIVARKGKLQTAGPKSGIGSWSSRSILVAFLLIAVVGSFISNAVHWPLEMLRLNVKVRSTLYARAGHPVPDARARDFGRLRDGNALSAGLAASPNYPAVQALERIRDLPLHERRRSALFVAQDQTPYWTMLTQKGACTFDPFVGPALSSVALIDGTPPFGCTLNRYYGLGSYPARTRKQSAEDAAPASLCIRAQKIGADQVIVLNFVGASSAETGTAVAPRAVTTVVNCKAPA